MIFLDIIFNEGTKSGIIHYLPVLSPLIVIILFSIDYTIKYKFKKKEHENNWFLKVLIEPQLINIIEFYTKSLELYVSSCNHLKSKFADIHYIKYQTEEFGKFSKEKRSIEFNVIMPIQEFNWELGKILTQIILEFEDNYKNNIEKKLFSSWDIEDFEKTVARSKSSFLSELYKVFNS